MQGKVALEEHFALPDTVQDSADFLADEGAKRADRILLSADWLFENIDHAAIWFDACTISEADPLKVGRTNARRLFGLNRAQSTALAQRRR